VRKSLDKLFTGTVLLCLVASAYISYYLRPVRWLPFNRTGCNIPDNPYAQIPLPESVDQPGYEKIRKAEKALV
jgi:hypothetical protein